MTEAAGIIAAAKPGFQAEGRRDPGLRPRPDGRGRDGRHRLDYRDLPGFPRPSVEGHAGRLSLGKIGETPVAVLQGRAHYYEHGRADAMKVPVRTLHALGCEALVLTNAGGSLDPAIGPGSVMLITDHINLVAILAAL